MLKKLIELIKEKRAQKEDLNKQNIAAIKRDPIWEEEDKAMLAAIDEVFREQEIIKKQEETLSYIKRIAHFQYTPYNIVSFMHTKIKKEIFSDNIFIGKNIINDDEISMMVKKVINEIFLNNKEDIEIEFRSEKCAILGKTHHCSLEASKYIIWFDFMIYNNAACVNEITLRFKEKDILITTNDGALIEKLVKNINKTYFNEQVIQNKTLKEFVQEYISDNKSTT